MNKFIFNLLLVASFFCFTNAQAMVVQKTEKLSSGYKINRAADNAVITGCRVAPTPRYTPETALNAIFDADNSIEMAFTETAIDESEADAEMLAQAGQSMLAQANQLPQGVLGLDGNTVESTIRDTDVATEMVEYGGGSSSRPAGEATGLIISAKHSNSCFNDGAQATQGVLQLLQ